MSELSERTFADDSGGVPAADVDVLSPVLEEHETVRYAMVSSKSIEHTMENRTTKIEPDGDNHAYCVVTGFRVLFILGTDAEDFEPDLELELGSITSAVAKSGLLSSSLIVTADQTEAVKFAPTRDADLEAVADYVSRLSGAWQDLEAALAGSREAIAEFEADLEEGQDTNEDTQRIRTRLNSAKHAATRNEDGPTEEMMARIEDLEAELETLLVRSRMDRVDVLLEEAEAYRADGDLADAIDAAVEADERLAEAKRDLADVDVPDEQAAAAVAERQAAVADLGEEIVADIVAACHDAGDTEDPTERAAGWATAREHVETALDAGWDGLAGVAEAALSAQRAWIVGRRVDALREAGLEREATADELGEDHDDAHDHYEAAKAHLQEARAIAEEFPHATPTGFEEPIERLEEKLEVSEWQWGQA